MPEKTISGSNFKSLTPLSSETVAQSYERYLYIRKQRKFRNYYELIDTWRTELEKTIFLEVDWSMEKKEYFFKEWENAYFEKPYGRRKGLRRRHSSAHAIDSITAGQFIVFFMQNFIDDPIRIQNAEISGLLWLLIRLTHQNNLSSPFTLDEVVNLPVKEFKIGTKNITVKNIEIKMSKGLINLFSILIHGKKQKDKVFSNLTVDSLEASFQKASKTILPTGNIAPSAFLIHPHSFLGQKISPPILHAMRNENVLEIQPGNYGGCFLRRFDLPKMKHKHHSTYEFLTV